MSRWSETLIPTLRNLPKDAEAVSHKLGLRSGLIQQLSSGVYSYLPLGFRSLLKIISIVREEMNRAGAAEVLLPALHPAEIWKKTGRYETLGEDKISFKNRSGNEFVLGPTHEEVITHLAANSVKSFRDLPITLYQIQTKFRDEARPRFGIIRTKEFIMKDAYSFDRDEAGLDVSYQKMSDAYHRIFTKVGLTFQVVTADTGMMGGSMSQEFMVVCPYGEDRVAKSDASDYLASAEVAARGQNNKPRPESQSQRPEVFETPNVRTIEELCSKYQLRPKNLVKTLIYQADDQFVAVLVSGPSEVNEIKLRKFLGATSISLAKAADVERLTKASIGFAGPIGLSIPVIADWDILNMVDFVTGANQNDRHLKNVCIDRDFKITKWGDIRKVQEDDLSPDGKGKLKLTTTMEIGHIFKLGTRYSKALEAEFLDEKGERKTIIMGCYGIGVNRILAAVIEEHHDEKGICWPLAVAPYAIHLITANQTIESVRSAAEKFYADCQAQKWEILYDDRDERAGVKFNDADLLGFPLQVVMGERNLKEGKAEIKIRKTGQAQIVELSQLIPAIKDILSSLQRDYS